MTDLVGARLLSFVERIERLEEEKKALQEDIKEVKSEAKGVGFDMKTLNKILRERQMSAEQISEEQALLDLYRAALGMLHDTPLGSAARKRFVPEDQPSEKSNKPKPKPVQLEEPYLSADIDKARELGKEDAQKGKLVTDNPYPADDKRRAAWDEAWCAASGSDGMDIPDAWRRKKPAKKDEGETKPEPKDNKGGKK